MSVSATLNYLAPWSARNSLYVAPGDQLTTTQYDPRTVPVADGRPHRDDLTLDAAGFELVSHASAVTDFSDSGTVRGSYRVVVSWSPGATYSELRADQGAR